MLKLAKASPVTVVQLLNTCIREFQLESVLLGDRLGEKVCFYTKPKFATASWCYLPPHKIFVGEGILDKLPESTGDADKKRYVKKFLRHERAHAKYTERNLKKIDDALKIRKIPFMLFNFFEDARIEACARQAEGTPFGWLEFEELAVVNHPLAVFYSFIQSDGNVDKVTALFCGHPPAINASEQLAGLVGRVAGYFRKALLAKDSWALIPLVEEWCREFDMFQEPGAMAAVGDLGIGLLLQSDEGFAEGFQADALPAGSSPLSSTPEVGPGPGANLVSKSGDLLGGTSIFSDEMENLSDRIRMTLARYFKPVLSSEFVTSPQKRLSIKQDILDRPVFIRKSVGIRKPKKVAVVFDCSGSMKGAPLEEGKILVRALSMLAEDGHITGQVIFTAESFGKEEAIHEVWKLPLTRHDTGRIQAIFPGEGLYETMTNVLSHLVNADYRYVYTDANIGDAPFNRAEFKKRGIFTTGLYAGRGVSCVSELLTYFDRAIVRDSCLELANAIAIQNF